MLNGRNHPFTATQTPCSPRPGLPAAAAANLALLLSEPGMLRGRAPGLPKREREICKHICISMKAYTYMHMYICKYAYIYMEQINIYTYMYIHVFVYLPILILAGTLYIHAHMHDIHDIHTCIDVYTYIYIYVYTYSCAIFYLSCLRHGVPPVQLHVLRCTDTCIHLHFVINVYLCIDIYKSL